jgi:hydrogenase assembly chaperone HypC/HupF
MSDRQEKSARKHLSVVPGLEMAGGESCVLDTEGHCITCSDEALPARVLQIDQELGTALVEVGDEPVEVDITLVDEVVPGGWLLVHGGVAIAAMDSGEIQPIGEVSDDRS